MSVASKRQNSRKSSGPHKKSGSRKPAGKKGGLALRLVAGIVAVVLAVLAVHCWDILRDNRLPAFEGDAQVYVDENTTPEDVILQIKSQTSIRWEGALRRTFERKQVSKYITPGHYTVKSEYSCVYVARMLNNCWQSPVKLSITPALRLKKDLVRSISSQLQLDSSTIAKALNDKAFLKHYGVTPATVYNIIIPDTYEVYWDISVNELFSVFKREYDKFWTDERRALAAQKKLTPEQVGILASIVCRESNYVPEYPKIAAVYVTRLRRGMPLQACPTVAFCYDYSLSRILDKHLKVDSPYNTYTHKGLPPGPIGIAPKVAIDAVLEADTNSGLMYFCASPALDGTNVFAKTYSQHQKNAKAFREAAYGK